MAVRIPKSKSMYLKENLAWISDSLGNAPKILLASDVMAVEKAVASARTEQTTYRVKSGDVLGKIAAQHGVTITQLKSWNNLSSNLIRVGQTLVIHGSSSSSNLAENSSGQKTYTVRPGDSLWVISQKHSLTIDQIKRLNNLNSNTIKPGQKLIIG